MYHPVSGRAIIALLTDFGSGDGYVGVMKGVMSGIVPDVHFIDITHEVAPQNVASGAWLLATSYRYFPAGTIFLCVVDPGVGSRRRPIALSAGDWFFVGPDNGLFSYVLAEQALHMVVELANPAYHLAQVSTTFHGRDVFSPVSAHIAHGVELAALGPSLDPATLHRLDNVLPLRCNDRIEAHIVHVDHFGNLITSIPLALVPEFFTSSSVQLHFPAQGYMITERRRFFSADSTEHKGEARPFMYVDSSGYVAVAVHNGNAARVLGISSSTEMISVTLQLD